MSDGAAALRAAAAQADRHRGLRQALTGSWQPGVHALPLTALRSERRTAGEKCALPRMAGQRSVRKRLSREASGAVPDDCGPDLDRLLELQEIEASVAATPHTAALDRAWRGVSQSAA